MAQYFFTLDKNRNTKTHSFTDLVSRWFRKLDLTEVYWLSVSSGRARAELVLSLVLEMPLNDTHTLSSLVPERLTMPVFLILNP